MSPYVALFLLFFLKKYKEIVLEMCYVVLAHSFVLFPKKIKLIYFYLACFIFEMKLCDATFYYFSA